MGFSFTKTSSSSSESDDGRSNFWYLTGGSTTEKERGGRERAYKEDQKTYYLSILRHSVWTLRKEQSLKTRRQTPWRERTSKRVPSGAPCVCTMLPRKGQQLYMRRKGKRELDTLCTDVQPMLCDTVDVYMYRSETVCLIVSGFLWHEHYLLPKSKMETAFILWKKTKSFLLQREREREGGGREEVKVTKRLRD